MARAGLTIGLLWHSATSDNLGVGALSVSQIFIIEDVARRIGVPVNFIILGWRDPRPSYIDAPNVERFDMGGREMVRPDGLYAAVRRCDLVLDIGGGDSFADIYGAKRIQKMLFGKFVVHAARRPMILSPQTIGPFSRGWARKSALASLNRCRAVFTRDAPSTRFLREIGFKGQVGEATDVAMRLPYNPTPPREDGTTRVGLNVSGLLMNGGYTGKNMFGLKADYPALVGALITYFTALPQVEMHLVGHVISESQPIEDDYRANEKLAAEFPDTVLAPRFVSPSEAKSYIAGLDFFMGARMHACIAAFSSGVPVIPMAYSRKFAGVFGTLGYDHTVDCGSEQNQEILAKIREGFESRAQLAVEVNKAFAMAKDRLALYEDVLDATMRDLAVA